MADWREEGQDPWPVKYPVEALPQESELPFRENKTRPRRVARWTEPHGVGMGKVDTGGIQKRLLWLLLAAEIGMLVVAACVLPLAFLNLPVAREGVVGAILTKVGEWLGLSSQTTYLAFGLPCPILLFTLGLSLWLYRWLVQRRRD